MEIPTKLLALTVLIMVLTGPDSVGQSRIITGTITDEDGVGMGGANITLRGSMSGVVSDAAGKFAISVPDDSTHLIFSFIGYTTVERKANGLSILNIQLTHMANMLSEVIVIGYGVRERKDVTGSVAVAEGEELSSIPTASIENNLQGRLAGVNVITSGQPGSSPLVIIRGASTFAGSSQPLYVVDGVPTLEINTLSPGDIESMVALKDAGAASIYGSRAASGVILITTKKGQAGSLKLTYSGSFGMQYPSKRITNLLDTQGVADLTWLAQRNSDITNPESELYGNGPDPVIPDYFRPAGKFFGTVDESKYDEQNNAITLANKNGTNWFDEVTQAAPVQNHDIAISGGSDNARYYVGFNYLDQKGIVLYTGAQRYSMRFNTEFKVSKNIRIGENITNTYRSASLISPSSRVNDLDFVKFSTIFDCYNTPAILPVFDVAGNFASVAVGNTRVVNPVANQWRSKDNKDYSFRTFGNVYTEILFLKDFTFRSSFGGSIKYGRSFAFTPKLGYTRNSYTEKSYDEADWNWQNTLTFKRNFGSHELTVLAGAEALKTDIGRGIEGTRSNYFSEDPGFWSLGSGEVGTQTNNGYQKTPSSLLGFFSRIDYSFNNRYLFSGTVRTDGSSKFINHQYGTFPSMTLGWRISEESFMQGIAFIQDLKLRAGYGIMGDQMNATPNNSYTAFTSNPPSSYYDIRGGNTSSTIGSAKVFIGYPDGQWQVNKTANIGLDFSLFNSHWSGTIDIYKKETEKLLYTLELPGTNGISTTAAQNVGTMENKGLDLTLTYQTNTASKWRVVASLTFTSYINEVTKIANTVPYFTTVGQFGYVRIQSGHPIGAFYGYKVDGLWQSQSQIDEADASDGDATTAFQGGAIPGRFRFRDVNDNGMISPDDRTFIGNPNPDFSSGLNISVAYKSFDIMLFLYGVQGNALFDISKLGTDFFGNGGLSKDLLNKSWTPERPDATIPMAEINGNYNSEFSSHYIQDGSYLRVKNIQLGYSLPRVMLQKAGIGVARIYIQTVNLLTFTKYTGLDPEVGGTAVTFGIAGTNFPQAKQFIVGINLEF